MVSLQHINGRNVWDILKLKVSEDQQDFVAGNDISLIEAYIAKAENGQIFPFGIYKNDLPIGFLMIDAKFQGRGYGKEALRLALEFIRTFPCGKAEFCWLSYEPKNKVAQDLYRSYGFVETGEKDGEEVIAVLKLSADVTEGTLCTKTLFSNDKCRTVK